MSLLLFAEQTFDGFIAYREKMMTRKRDINFLMKNFLNNNAKQIDNMNVMTVIV